MNYRHLIFFMAFVFLVKPVLGFTRQDIFYTYGGNFKAKLYLPDTSLQAYPAVIFCYDDFYQNAGEKMAKEKGYDLDAFAEFFTKQGYLVFVPVGDIQNLLSIRGACQFLQRYNLVIKSDITLVASNTQAVTSLAAFTTRLPIKSLVLITPRDIDDTQFTSTFQIKRLLPNITCKIFILGTERESNWMTQSQQRLNSLLVSSGKQVEYKTYLYKKPWFWNPKNPFMKDILDFMMNKPFSNETMLPNVNKQNQKMETMKV